MKNELGGGECDTEGWGVGRGMGHDSVLVGRLRKGSSWKTWA